jgi:SAM-dependent methyltransferase
VASVVAYYDGFRERLLEDYEVGNRRVVAAIEFAKEALAGADSVLDVGCGIGWSSQEMALMGASVTGLDISPVLVETAREEFGHLCEFETGDFCEWKPRPFDAVLMIDVYEHFPAERRPQVHERIRATGAQRVALTVPTPWAQQYARELGIPLQPIDEAVTDEAIETLARDVSGRVLVNRTVSIWRDDDYRHVLVER